MRLSQMTAIPPMTDDMIERVRCVENKSRQWEQVNIPVQHFLHAGMYVRTVKIPAGVVITGALVIIDTVLIVSGHAMIHTGERWIESTIYNVIAAASNRKQIFVAITDVDLTMCFPTDAKNVKEAEENFTNEFSLLQNRGVECQE